jgi:SAM-dependent methyltransferase
VKDSEQAVFSKSYMLRMRLRMITQELGPMHQRKALCVGAIPSGLRARLLALGGDWSFAEDRAQLPFKDGTFDRVLLIDHLEWVADDYAFIAEAHRVLKTAGTLLVDADHMKAWTVWRPVRRLFGVADRDDDRVREGYAASGLFDILKDGFDVQETRTYSRFFLEATETISRLAIGAFMGSVQFGESEEEQAERVGRRVYTIQSVTYPFFVLSSWLDWLLFFTRGYRLMAVARRRLWKPRRTPVLRDGRTLADATLNAKIGTAADF